MAFIVGMIICFTIWNPIFNFLTQPLCSTMAARGQEDCGLILIALQEGFFVAISISLLGGFILSFPIISYQLWRFVAPGLYKNEKGAFLPFLIASPFMFLLGASFAFYVVTPLAFDFFLGFQQPGTLTGDVENEGVFEPHNQIYRGLRNVFPTACFADAFGQGRIGEFGWSAQCAQICSRRYFAARRIGNAA
ncbi:UNVERIFIED_CONTAM: hypothetical protein GTU68_058662 [Idotea baltica]|nr:hypothetical protein [Idotea baltica]